MTISSTLRTPSLFNRRAHSHTVSITKDGSPYPLTYRFPIKPFEELSVEEEGSKSTKSSVGNRYCAPSSLKAAPEVTTFITEAGATACLARSLKIGVPRGASAIAMLSFNLGCFALYLLTTAFKAALSKASALPVHKTEKHRKTHRKITTPNLLDCLKISPTCTIFRLSS